MFCRYCGRQVAEEAAFCPHCGQSQRGVPTSRLEDDPSMRMLLPVGRTGLSIAAGYAGLLALLVIFAPIALGLGIAAVIELRRDRSKRGMGRAVFGLVMGAVGTLLLLAVLVGMALES